MESGHVTGLTFAELDLAATLRSGQVFRWQEASDGSWQGMLGTRRVRLAQSTDGTTLSWKADGPDSAAAVRSFLRLGELDLVAQAHRWSALDPLFADAWRRQPGVRILRQEPDECFFSFLCASVAPIARISKMLQAVAAAAGDDYGDGFRAFPSASALTALSETRLRELGLGFRATRVVAAARHLADAPPTVLSALRGQPLETIRTTLTAFNGVGTKIADCIALFALDRDEAVPVDTHIWRIATTHYDPSLADCSLTAATYARAAGAYQRRFGPYAGWAQQVLFYRAAVEKLR